MVQNLYITLRLKHEENRQLQTSRFVKCSAKNLLKLTINRKISCLDLFQSDKFRRYVDDTLLFPSVQEI